MSEEDKKSDLSEEDNKSDLSEEDNKSDLSESLESLEEGEDRKEDMEVG